MVQAGVRVADLSARLLRPDVSVEDGKARSEHATRNNTFLSAHIRGRGDVVVRLLASQLGEPGSITGGVTSGFFARGNRTAGFLGDLPFRCLSIPHFTLIGSQYLDVKASVYLALESHRHTQCDENTARQFRALRLAAMGDLMRVAVSPLTLPHLSSSNAEKRSRSTSVLKAAQISRLWTLEPLSWTRARVRRRTCVRRGPPADRPLTLAGQHDCRECRNTRGGTHIRPTSRADRFHSSAPATSVQRPLLYTPFAVTSNFSEALPHDNSAKNQADVRKMPQPVYTGVSTTGGFIDEFLKTWMLKFYFQYIPPPRANKGYKCTPEGQPIAFVRANIRLSRVLSNQSYQLGPSMSGVERFGWLRNARVRETGDPRGYPPISVIIPHDSHELKSGSDLAWNRNTVRLGVRRSLLSPQAWISICWLLTMEFEIGVLFASEAEDDGAPEGSLRMSRGSHKFSSAPPQDWQPGRIVRDHALVSHPHAALNSAFRKSTLKIKIFLQTYVQAFTSTTLTPFVLANLLCRTRDDQLKSEVNKIPGGDFRTWESCRTMPLVGGFSRGSPASPAPEFRRCFILTSLRRYRLSRPRC
ncbi:hypothetical protein PR048_003267 [Dryococelus australis]|uniref:Uncharacterized protein n=1 Tax=Dryococelus australis TaxID=614101 RepID=A0ABQ9IP23_9NEOP|nr:hypothetical protein PR048_003267 [Dryococelus australis]